MLYSPSRGIWQPSRELLANLTLREWEQGTRPWHKSRSWRPGQAWCPGLDIARKMHALGIIFPSPTFIRRGGAEIGTGGGGGAPAGGTLASSLTAAWEFEEASGTRVDGSGNVNLTEHGSVAQGTGKIANCASFSSNASNYFTLATNSKLALTVNRQFEISIWYNQVNNSAKTALDAGSTATSGLYLIAYNGFIPGVRVFGNGVQIDASTFGAFTNNTWYLVHIYDDGANFGVFVNNGSNQTATRGSSNSTDVIDFRIGENTSGGAAFNGLLDQCFVWIGRSLTSAERTYLYNAGSGRTYAAVSLASP